MALWFSVATNKRVYEWRKERKKTISKCVCVFVLLENYFPLKIQKTTTTNEKRIEFE